MGAAIPHVSRSAIVSSGQSKKLALELDRKRDSGCMSSKVPTKVIPPIAAPPRAEARRDSTLCVKVMHGIQSLPQAAIRHGSFDHVGEKTGNCFNALTALMAAHRSLPVVAEGEAEEGGGGGLGTPSARDQIAFCASTCIL
jgi:hypothetical protein